MKITGITSSEYSLELILLGGGKKKKKKKLLSWVCRQERVFCVLILF